MRAFFLKRAAICRPHDRMKVKVFGNMFWLGIERMGAHMGTERMFTDVSIYRRKEKYIDSSIFHTFVNIYWSIAT
jgi:hypothetical protein